MSNPEQLRRAATWVLDQFLGQCWLGVDLIRVIDDEMWMYRLRQVSELTAIPLVAAGHVLEHAKRPILVAFDDAGSIPPL